MGSREVFQGVFLEFQNRFTSNLGSYWGFTFARFEFDLSRKIQTSAFGKNVCMG